jgi:ankyrin repeat protein
MKKTLIILSAVALLGCNQTAKKQPDTGLAENTTVSQSEERHNAFIKEIDGYQYTELGLACRTGDLNKAKQLIEKGACKSSCMTDDIFEYDALYVSVMFGKIDLVNYFIPQEEDIDRMCDESGTTFLGLACFYKDKAIADKMAGSLIRAGANVNGLGDTGFDYVSIPLHNAALSNNLPLVKRLVTHGADIFAKNKQNETLFTMLGYSGVDAAMKKYIRSLPTVNVSDKNWLGLYKAAAGDMIYYLYVEKDSCIFEGKRYLDGSFRDRCRVQKDGGNLYCTYLASENLEDKIEHAPADTVAILREMYGQYFIETPLETEMLRAYKYDEAEGAYKEGL